MANYLFQGAKASASKKPINKVSTPTPTPKKKVTKPTPTPTPKKKIVKQDFKGSIAKVGKPHKTPTPTPSYSAMLKPTPTPKPKKKVVKVVKPDFSKMKYTDNIRPILAPKKKFAPDNNQDYAEKLIQRARDKGYTRFGINYLLKREGDKVGVNLTKYYKTKEKDEIKNQINKWYKEYKSYQFDDDETISMINNNLKNQANALNKVYKDYYDTALRAYNHSIGADEEKLFKSSEYKGVNIGGYDVITGAEVFPIYKDDDILTKNAKMIVNGVGGAVMSALGVVSLADEGLRQYIIQSKSLMEGKGFQAYKQTNVVDDMIPLFLPGRAGQDLQNAIKSIDNDNIRSLVETTVELLGSPLNLTPFVGGAKAGARAAKLAKGLAIPTAKEIENMAALAQRALIKLNKVKEANILKDAVYLAKSEAKKNSLKGVEYRGVIKQARYDAIEGIAKKPVIQNKLRIEIDDLAKQKGLSSDEVIKAYNKIDDNIDDITKAIDDYAIKNNLTDIDAMNNVALKDIAKSIPNQLDDITKLYRKPNIKPKVKGDIGYATTSTVKSNVLGTNKSNNFGTGTVFVATKNATSRLGKKAYKPIKLDNNNLYKPATEDMANKLDEFLGMVDDYADEVMITTKSGKQLPKVTPTKMYKYVKELFPHTPMDEFTNRLNSVKSYIKSVSKKLQPQDELDTAGTKFMKELGYNGVDNRAFSGLDSVVYDLKTATGELAVIEKGQKEVLGKALQRLETSIDKTKNGAVATTGLSDGLGASGKLLPVKQQVEISLAQIRKPVDYLYHKTNFLNVVNRIDKIVSKAIGKQLKGTESVERLAIMARDSVGSAEEMIRGWNLISPIGAKYKNIPSWHKILASVKKSKDKLYAFNELLLHRNAIDRAKYGKFVFAKNSKDLLAQYPEGTAQHTLIKDLMSKYKIGTKSSVSEQAERAIHQALSKFEVERILKQYPEFVNIEKKVRQFINTFIDDWVVGTGRVSKEQMSSLRKKYPNWIMTYREVDDELARTLSKNPKISAGEFVKLAAKSDKNIYLPTEIMEGYIKSTVKKGRANQLYQTIYNHTKNNKELLKNKLGITIGQTDDSIKAMTTDDNINIGIQQLLESDGKRKVIVFIDGTPHTINVHNKLLYDGLKILQTGIEYQGTFGTIVKGARKVTNAFKEVTTQSSPVFGVLNTMRDIPFAFINSRSGGIRQLKNTITGMYSRANSDELYQIYASLNGSGGNFFSESILKTSNPINKFNNAIEDMSRYAAFRSSLEKAGGALTYDNIVDALYAAKKITVDFGQYGSWTKTIDAFVPYFNAAVQGLDTVARAVIKHPIATISRGLTAYTLPSIALDIYNSNNKYYKELNQYIKDTHFLIPNMFGAKDENGVPMEFIKLKRDREFGTLFGALPQRLLQQAAEIEHNHPNMFNLQAIGLGQLEQALAKMYYNNPEVWRDFGDTLTRSFVPTPDTIIEPLISLQTNKDYRGMPVIPARFEDIKDVDFVIETVMERMDIKKEIFSTAASTTKSQSAAMFMSTVPVNLERILSISS